MNAWVFTAFLIAFGSVESQNDSWAINPHEQAYGLHQCRQRALTDLNRHYGTRWRLREFLGNPTRSNLAVVRYGDLYGAKTAREYYMIWVRGPTGAKRPETPELRARWERVEREWKRLMEERP